MAIPNPLTVVERFGEPGVKDALLLASIANLPAAGTVTATLDFEMHSRSPVVVAIEALGTVNLAANITVGIKVDFYNGANIIETASVANVAFISGTPLSYAEQFPIPTEPTTKAILTITYISGTQPATPVVFNFSYRPR